MSLITEQELESIKGSSSRERFSNEEYRKLVSSKGVRFPDSVTWNKTPLKIKEKEFLQNQVEEGLPYFEDISLKEAVASERNKTDFFDSKFSSKAKKEVIKQEEKSFFRGLKDNKKVKAGLRFSAIQLGSSFLFPGEFKENLATNITWEAASFAASKKGIKGWKNLAIGVAGGAAGRIALNMFSSSGNRFSGKDDSYNTIEGLRHGGMAEGIRKDLTDFGSGYQGLPSSLMGIDIDPRILSFREDVLNDKDKRRELEARLKRKQEEAQKGLGSFSPRDYLDNDLSDVEGLSNLENLREVNLSQFNLKVEDADTIILNRKGSLFDEKPLHVRLSGVDAPETTAHSDDPMEEVRIWQNQEYGEEASARLEDILENQDDIRLIIDKKNQTYGRSLGALVGDDNKNINLQLVKEGMVSALPFGKSSSDVINRDQAEMLESSAQEMNKGMWSFARYKAIKEATGAIGQPITYNTLTEINKISSNLNLGAYTSFLEQLDGQRELTEEEVNTSQRAGRSLRKSHGPNRFSGKGKNYNTIEGMHPKGSGPGVDMIRSLTEFGSGWDVARSIARSIYKGIDEQAAFDKLRRSSQWEGMLSGAKEIKKLSSGSFGTTFLMEGTINKEKLQFIKKIPESELYEKFKDFIPNLPDKEQRVKALKKESEIMPFVEDKIAPSVYGYKKDALYMELMPGKTIHELLQEGADVPLEEIESVIGSEINRISKLGVKNTDIHTGNIMYDPSSKKTSWIDWGLGGSSDINSSKLDVDKMKQNMSEKLITPIKQSSKKQSSSKQDFFDDWGDINSVSEPKSSFSSSKINKEMQKKRVSNFNQVSRASVGIGLKKAYNGSRRHSRFSSTNSF